MISFPTLSNTPIGLDIGTSSIKLVQLNSDYSKVHESVRYDFSIDNSLASNELDEAMDRALSNVLSKAKQGRRFRGNEVVVCLNHQDLCLQNIKIERDDSRSIDQVIQQEAAGRVPYSVTEAELRHFDTCLSDANEAVNRDIIIMACHRPKLEQRLDLIERAGFSPIAVDVEPIAVLRSFTKQHRRESDREERVFYVHIGYSNSMVVIAEGDHILFVKYIDIGGNNLDKAVASHLNLSQKEAANMRKHHGDRRRKRRDSEVTKSLSESTRNVIEKLCAELSMCIRYHSVTFRGKPLVKMILTGGEANEEIQQELGQRLSLDCELGDPIRNFENSPASGRTGQWDVATGLALRNAPETTIYEPSKQT
ncbi:MAG: hypothetical protein COA78_03340 [Blastopirellula sp.]|nr:MAG: hypothetical protein COA78_03340 [Blastopirellula sp.]